MAHNSQRGKVLMEYTLNVRAFLEFKRKEKANAHAARLFPKLPFENVGRYWKDDRQWEIRIHYDCEYTDDKTALWEILSYFKQVLPNWLLTLGPNDTSFELLFRALGENCVGTGLTWCNVEVWRGAGHCFLDETQQ